ncbi:MAG: hypothetical protein R2932_28555 [Caldilineaceae bacterium]
MEFAEMGADVFAYMNGRKPEGRPVTRGDIKAAAEGVSRPNMLRNLVWS